MMMMMMKLMMRLMIMMRLNGDQTSIFVESELMPMMKMVIYTCGPCAGGEVEIDGGPWWTVEVGIVKSSAIFPPRFIVTL